MRAMRVRWAWTFLWAASIGAVAWAAQAVRHQETSRPRELVLFVSPGSATAADAARQLRARGGARTRVVLLVNDFMKAGAWIDDDAARSLFKTLQESGLLTEGAPLFDEEGLDLAKRLGVTKLPAFAVVDGGTARLAYGAGVDVAEMLK